MSIYPQANALYNLRVPMPIPRTTNAPFFNGRYIDDFLNRITLHASQAGETDLDAMVKYILEYSSDQVKDTIINMDEFDIDRPLSLKWGEAKRALHSLYGSTDKPREHSEEELKEFCRQQSAKSSFSKLSEVESYLREFVGIAASLKKRGVITTKRYDYYFVLGLPHSMKEWFLSAAPETKRTRDDPPTLEESLKILRTRFDKQSLIYEEWNLDVKEKAESPFDDFGNRVTVTIPPTGNVLDAAVSQTAQGHQVKSANKSQAVAPSKIDEITMRLDALTLAISGRQRPPRCFICGNPCGQEGVHPTGPRFCPETSKLLADRLMDFDSQRSRYVLPDGNDLPRIPQGWSGGVATYLRHLRNSANPTASTNSVIRDDPPHMRSTHSVGLMYNNTEVLEGDGFGLNTFPYEYNANPSTRSGLDTATRFDPRSQENRPDRYKKSIQTPTGPSIPSPRNNTTPAPIQQPTVSNPPSGPSSQPPPHVRFAPDTATIPNTSRTSIPPPTNPINKEQGWKASKPGNPRGGYNDVEMRDADGKKMGNNQYHFTSKVQDYADPQSMISRIGDMRIEVPLFQLLGLSPQLSKLMSENTRTKREYGGSGNTKSAESYPHIPYDPFEAREEERAALSAISGIRGPESTERHAYVDDQDPMLEDFVFRCSSGVAQIPSTRFFAMTVGDIRLTINGVQFLAMIDTGSEMNVAGDHLPEAASLAMDFDGMRWSLKGINGDFERLRGCAIDAPMIIGGHKFGHHIFISRQQIGRHDIILGQPFLQEYSARLDYERGNHCKLFLWSNGDRSARATLMISITDPNNPRNASAIRLGQDAKSSSSRIEEVYDPDF